MKFGYMMQLQMPRPWAATTEREAYANAIEQAVKAEEVGFDRIWLTEQHFYVEIGHIASPDMLLAAISQRTERIRLASCLSRLRAVRSRNISFSLSSRL